MPEIIENLGPVEARKRWVPGLIVFIITLVVIFYLLSIDTPVPWWGAVLVFISLLFGFLGLDQGLKRTCVMNAFRGTEDFDSGEVAIEESGRARKLKKKGRLMLLDNVVKALTLAALFTYLTYL
ncbi:hypothetical protein GF324_06300 [bacterium]|nr:hypothetical protein [bacterium]